MCGASCSYLPITDEVGEFIDVFAAEYCLMSPVEDDVALQNDYLRKFSISDETTGNGVFQRPY